MILCYDMKIGKKKKFYLLVYKIFLEIFNMFFDLIKVFDNI